MAQATASKTDAGTLLSDLTNGRQAVRRSIVRRWAAGVVLLAIGLWTPGLAQARWLRAESARFVVYCACDEREVRDYANELEDFDVVLRTYHGMSTTDAAPRKLDVFMVNSEADLKVTAPGLPDKTAGYYRASLGGIVTVAQRSGYAGQTILFHEYVHHFMHQYFAYAYPAWLVEGWAEYFGSSKIEDQQVLVGEDAAYLPDYLRSSKWLPLSDLLTKRPLELSPDDIGRYYTEALFLTSYMLADPTRRQQLDAYVRGLGAGKDSLTAFQDATGLDPDALTRRLKGYSEVIHARFKRAPRPAAEVKVTALPASADSLMLYKIRLSRIDRATDPGALQAVRTAAARFAGDPFADDILAKAELIWGDPTKADTIIERRMNQAPNDLEPIWLAALSRMIAAGDDPAQQKIHYPQARPYLLRAYKLDPTDFRVLSIYATTRSSDPGYPSDSTVDALVQAHGLAPQVADITLQAADALIRRHRLEEARVMLTPLANDPHASSSAQAAAAKLMAQTTGPAAKANPAS